MLSAGAAARTGRTRLVGGTRLGTGSAGGWAGGWVWRCWIGAVVVVVEIVGAAAWGMLLMRSSRCEGGLCTVVAADGVRYDGKDDGDEASRCGSMLARMSMFVAAVVALEGGSLEKRTREVLVWWDREVLDVDTAWAGIRMRWSRRTTWWKLV